MFDTYAIEDWSLDQLAARKDQLEKMQTQTHKVMRRKIAEHYELGEPITTISKKSGLSRVTIYAWLKEQKLV
jgi:DNA invertase Pin-like site-specific DNA recombinase